MEGEDPTLVGLGSFIVNAQADCNGCHGSDPANEFLTRANPYVRKPLNGPMQFNQATYLNGGQNFGPAGPGIVLDPNSPLNGEVPGSDQTSLPPTSLPTTLVIRKSGLT